MTKSRFLGEFEQYVILAVLRLDQQAYGSSIRQLLHDVIHRDVSIGALYTTLSRLEEKGLVESKMGEATAQRGGRAKKFFVVTGAGKQALQQSRQALDAMWRDVKLAFIEVAR
ncbi:MAG: helix-turn-helix transcriptional regulator [Alteromonadaceae bacterium]|nr:helix-turn-helix transcriptional regulator [Alteromonadaceae bacterium]